MKLEIEVRAMVNFVVWTIYLASVTGVSLMKWATVLIVYHALINIVAFIMCSIDKNRAIQGRYRIPEKTLFLVSFLGGAVGMWFAMQSVRHKTKHVRFMLGIPLIALINSAAVGYGFYIK